MAENVKGAPGLRQRKALATRRRVLDAAETLFVRDGFAATTIAAIADEADVAVQTVYAVFGTKRAVLTELLAVRVVGDDRDAPLRDRDDWRAMEAEVDPRRQLALLAAIATRIGARLGALYDVLAGAAAADAEMADVFARQQQARHDDQARLARLLAQRGALRPGLTAEQATDVMWAVANPRMYASLVIERGWAPADYEVWLADALGAMLLDRTGEATATVDGR